MGKSVECKLKRFNSDLWSWGTVTSFKHNRHQSNVLESDFTRYSYPWQLQGCQVLGHKKVEVSCYSLSIRTCFFCKSRALPALSVYLITRLCKFQISKLHFGLEHRMSRHTDVRICKLTRSTRLMTQGTRMHGIAGLSQDPSGTRLIATCVDSKWVALMSQLLSWTSSEYSASVFLRRLI